MGLNQLPMDSSWAPKVSEIVIGYGQIAIGHGQHVPDRAKQAWNRGVGLTEMEGRPSG